MSRPLTTSEREAAATIADYAARLQKQTELTEAAIEDAAREYERAETWCERERVARVALELAELRATRAADALEDLFFAATPHLVDLTALKAAAHALAVVRPEKWSLPA